MLAPALHLMMPQVVRVRVRRSNGARAGVHERVGVIKLLLNYARARTRGHNVNHEQSPTYFTFNGCSV